MKSLALVVFATACYGAAPGKPPQIPLPPVEDGADISVHSETKTTMEQVPHTAWSCPAGHGDGDPACTRHDYTETEPVTRTTTTAAYGDQPISYAQFQVMTDAKRDEKLAELDELSHKCQRANIPRYAGIASMVGGLALGLLVGNVANSATAGQAIAYAGLIGGAASYTLGFFAFGGRDCVGARELYNNLDHSQQMSWTSVQGEQYADQMKAAAEQFNAGHGRRATLEMRDRAGKRERP
jgi:hypothetical protein